MATISDPFVVAAGMAADIFDPPTDPYATDPVGFARDKLGFESWSKQREIMESVRDNTRTAVRACNGPGKTATAAEIALWFLAAHPNESRVVTTAPTWVQVAELLWREIRAAVGRAHKLGELTAWPIPSSTKLDLGAEWFAIGHSTNEPERFAGHHARWLLLIIDEASGVDERIFEAGEGFLTAEGSRLLLLGNPTKKGGTFHRAFTKEAALWNPIHISAYDCPNETGEEVPEHVARALPRKGWADERKAAWGEKSPIYQVRVLGNFAREGTNEVCDLGDVEDAQARELPEDASNDLAIIACDVARFGSDETVITERTGQRCRILETYIGNPTTHTAGRIAHYKAQHKRKAVVRIVVDDAGVGGGVVDQLRAEGHAVTAFNASETAFDPLAYPNRRSELWFQLADQLEDIDLDDDEQLLADLVTPVYRYDTKMRRVVESKDEMRKRLGRSPDRADGIMLLLVPEGGSAGAVVKPAGKRPKDGRRSTEDLRRMRF